MPVPLHKVQPHTCCIWASVTKHNIQFCEFVYLILQNLLYISAFMLTLLKMLLPHSHGKNEIKKDCQLWDKYNEVLYSFFLVNVIQEFKSFTTGKITLSQRPYTTVAFKILFQC